VLQGVIKNDIKNKSIPKCSQAGCFYHHIIGNQKKKKKKERKKNHAKMYLRYRRITSLFKAGFDDNEQMYHSMFIYRETRQNSSIQRKEKKHMTVMQSAQIITQQNQSNKILYVVEI
jgi:hypothetical protein